MGHTLVTDPMPRHERAVKAAAARWGDVPRHVRIADLSEPQRRLVAALVAAVRAAADPPEPVR